MSRNFELLQKIGREQALYATAADEPVQEMEPPPVIVPVGSRLKIEGAELEEITKVVQRVFLLPGNDAPRTVVFSGSESRNGCSWVCARVAEVMAAQLS